MVAGDLRHRKYSDCRPGAEVDMLVMNKDVIHKVRLVDKDIAKGPFMHVAIAQEACIGDVHDAVKG
jgi:hypothetical protein